MSELKIISTAAAPAAIGPYSQAVRVGDVVYCSGQIGLDPASGEVVAGGVAVQAERVLSNLAAVLDAAGSSLGRVLKTTVYLRDLADYEAVNEIYARHFGDHAPARAAVEVSRLPKDVLVEIDCVAAVLR